MADEPENIVLRLLREIRDTQDKHSALLEDHSRQFKEIRRELHDWQETTATTLGFAGHANVRIESLQKQVDELTARLDRLERQH
ncbi:hypothetical protein [Enterovirga aerilata]|uniref:Uncharacterized protein n=1 Tax=Enterovirga aerilata TaxID=2730920 RepID=A0A849I4Q9_9HYPH|nr:hypothetical protein [Enterovirga sp. DB1703]NNM72348.1 hypothetical protein [Enterovirga sp. DB1703]